MGNSPVTIYFSEILSPLTCLSDITKLLFVHFVENGHFDYLERKITVTSTIIIEFSWDAYFWVLQKERFHMIYNKSYDHQKFKIMISESIGRFFVTRFPSHLTRKRRKGNNNRMRNLINNNQSEKTKFFRIRMSRFPWPADFIIWTISWPSDDFLRNWRK